MLIDRLHDTSANFAKCIERFFSTCPEEKTCAIDQAHVAPKRDQNVLPNLIDRFSGQHRSFILAATNITKLTPEIRSRLTEVSFDFSPRDREASQKRLMARCANVLAEKGIVFDEERLKKIIEDEFPDLRSVANHIEFEFW